MCIWKKDPQHTSHGDIVEPVLSCRYCGRRCDPEVLSSGLTWIQYHEKHCEVGVRLNREYLAEYAGAARVVKAHILNRGRDLSAEVFRNYIRAYNVFPHLVLPASAYVDAYLDAFGC